MIKQKLKFAALIVTHLDAILVLFSLASYAEPQKISIYEQVVAATSWTQNVAQKHQECAARPNPNVSKLCKALAELITAKDELLYSAGLYCNGNNLKCKEMLRYNKRLQAALTLYKEEERQMKRVLR